jgi:hypothetical protein
MPIASPMPAAQALSAYAQQARGNFPQFRIVSNHDAPDLPPLRQMEASQHPQGVAVRVAYVMRGTPVEEEFYGSYYLSNACSQVPTGRVCETDWGFFDPHSFRAPAGALDRRLPVLTAIESSQHPNPAWLQRVLAVRAEIRAQATRSIKEGFAGIEAAKVRSQQIVARSNASLAAADRQDLALRGGGGGGGEGSAGGRSAADKTDDYLRGVTTLNDPNGGTTQRTSNRQYHWTDGNGSYRDSDDPSYNPNNTENGSWQLMSEAP